MADEKYTFEQTRVRLEEIAAQARKKDTSLEKSLDLLEEGARLALQCTELVDHTDFNDDAPSPASGPQADPAAGPASADATPDPAGAAVDIASEAVVASAGAPAPGTADIAAS